MKSVPELSTLNVLHAWVSRVNEVYPKLRVEGRMVIGNITQPVLFSTFLDMPCLCDQWERLFNNKEFLLEDKLVLSITCSSSSRSKLKRLKIDNTLEIPLVWNKN